MLLLSISIWIVLVYSLKIFATGNPAYDLVKDVPSPMLSQAADCLESEIVPENEIIYSFIRAFFRLTAVACSIFILELIIVFYFIYEDPYLPIPWIILVKDFIMVWMGYSLHQKGRKNIFESVLQVPSWCIWLERISYLITSVCFIVLFLKVNDFI